LGLINQINSETVLYGVIGDPIKQSKSPIMLNRAFQESGINAVYTAFHITNESLADFIKGVRVMGIGGVNVTIPHKLQVMDLLDEIDADAIALGAVNTIVNRDGRLIGYNTDGIGYVRSLKEEAISDIAGKSIVVVGAGGAARGIIYALLKEKPSKVTIINRSVANAEQLAVSLTSEIPIQVAGQDQLEACCGEADIVINTTSVGMYPHMDETPIRGEWLKSSAVASDLIYNPLETKFLQQAKQYGCTIHGGLGMFIYQGAFAFEYWTGKQAPVLAMRETVLQALGS